MIQRLFAVVLLAGACTAYPHEDEKPKNRVDPVKRHVHSEGGAFNPEQDPIHPERFPVDPVKGSVNPEKGPFNPEKDSVGPEGGQYNSENGPVDPERTPFPDLNVPIEAPGNLPIPKDSPKSDSDLKTDATFWWPYYRSYWGYPAYRSYSYWSYPTYYTPRYYYW